MSYVIAKTVQSVGGDCWDTISKRVYGTEKLFNVLAAANPGLAQYAQLPAGLTINIPFIKVQLPSSSAAWSNLTK
jgi:phage tail protein X